MAKLYYTNPLHAAIMAQEFGVLINVDTNHKSFIHNESMFLEYGFKIDDSKVNTWIAFSTCDKFYIHPDSYDIFEPKIGDLVAIDFGGGRFHEEIEFIMPWDESSPGFDPEYKEGWEQKLQYCFNNVGMPVFRNQIKAIIQRDGKAFFTPQIDDLTTGKDGQKK